MKTLLQWLGGAVLATVFLLAVSASTRVKNWNLLDLDPSFRAQVSRACVYPIDGWAVIDCSNAVAATSAQLNQWSRYVIQCGDDSYLATGDASGDVADSSDGWLPSGAWLDFVTTDTVRYMSCLNKNADSDCRIWECQ